MKMVLHKALLIIFIVFIFPFQSFSANIDSLKSLIQTATGERLVDLYNEIAREMPVRNREMLNYAENADEIASSLKYNFGRAEALKNIGRYHHDNKEYEEALEYFFRSKQFYSADDYESISKVNERIAVSYMKNKDNENAILYFQKAIDLLKKFPLNSYHPDPNNNLGLFYWQLSKYDSALVYYNQALDAVRALNDSTYMGRLLNNIGVIYWQWTLYDKAIEYYLKSLDIRYAIKDSAGVGRLLNNIGLTYLEAEEYDKAMNYFKKGLELGVDLKDEQLKGYSKFNMGQVYVKQKIYDKALELYKQSRIHYNLGGNYGGDLLTSIHIGEMFNTIQLPDSALIYLNNALQRARDLNNQKRIAMSLLGMGKSYFLLQKYEKALSVFDEAMDISTRIGTDDVSTSILFERAGLLKKIGNYESALQDYLTYFEMKDSVENIEVQRKILEYQSKFETQQAKIELNEKEIELARNEVLLFSASAAIVVLSVLLVILFRTNHTKKLANFKLNEINETVHRKNEEIFLQKGKIEDAFIELNNQKNELDLNISTKDKLFSILAHDIKNPLGVILNYADLLKQRDSLSIDELNEIIDSISSSSHKLSELLNTILTWSQNQQGLINIQKEKIDLKSEIGIATEPLISWIQEKRIEFENLTPSIGIFADRFMFNTIIRNLVHNSIKYTPEGGKITVEASEDDSFTYINVSDTGSGISKEKLGRIFTGIKDEKVGESTGLGLKICKEFIEKQNGLINVVSEIGRGTTFSLKLPKF